MSKEKRAEYIAEVLIYIMEECDCSNGGCSRCKHENICIAWFEEKLDYLFDEYPGSKFPRLSDNVMAQFYLEWLELTGVARDAQPDTRYILPEALGAPLCAIPTASQLL